MVPDDARIARFQIFLKLVDRPCLWPFPKMLLETGVGGCSWEDGGEDEMAV